MHALSPRSAPSRTILQAARLLVALTLSLAVPPLLPHACLGGSAVTANGTTINFSEPVKRIICSGPGCLRLVCYLKAQDLVVAVDDAETKNRIIDARPYALAHKGFKTMPVFGEFRGHDNPEQILTLKTQPQLIFKTYPDMGHDPEELQEKTGLPVIPLHYGDLDRLRPRLTNALRAMGKALDKQARAEEVVAFFEETIRDLKRRVGSVPESEKPGVFVGGVAFKGPHGYQSTEPAYPPFVFVGAKNLAHDGALAEQQNRHSVVSKETILAWDPAYLFLDLSTLQLGEASGLAELQQDPAYQSLTAVGQGKVYGLLPYNWYSKNYGSILANAYFIGKLLHPKAFADIDPVRKADEIFTFLVGKPVFEELNAAFGALAYKPVPVH